MAKGVTLGFLGFAVGAMFLLSLPATPGEQRDSGSQSNPIIVAAFVPGPGLHWAEDFRKYVIPHVDAVMVRVDWNEIESTHGNYDFSALDRQIGAWAKLGKKSAVILSLQSDEIVGGGPNKATPKYVLSAAWAQQCCQSKPLNTVSCPFNSNPVPVVYEKPFVAAAQSVIAAALKHLEGNSSVLYMRAGYVEGGENTPICHAKWPGWSNEKFLQYFQEMTDYIAGLHSSVRFVQNANAFLGMEVADREADILHRAGFGIGMQNLKDTDKDADDRGKPCAGDWCAWARKYPRDFRYLQPSIKQSTPQALAVYLPLARKLGINALEIFPKDLLMAYAPNYPGYAENSAALRAALEH
jgi:hypothetical protein